MLEEGLNATILLFDTCGVLLDGVGEGLVGHDALAEVGEATSGLGADLRKNNSWVRVYMKAFYGSKEDKA